MEVKIINKSKYPNPEYKNPGDAGMDLRANIETPITINTLERVCIPTGLYLGVPEGYELQVRPRSGLAVKNGITVLNTPGTVDAGYRGEIGVIIINLSQEKFTINPGDRIAQAVLNKFETIVWENTETLDETERASGGFGSTGRN